MGIKAGDRPAPKPQRARPPLAKAREHATTELIKAHQAEHDRLMTDFLAGAGWSQPPETVTRWVRGEPSVDAPDD